MDELQSDDFYVPDFLLNLPYNAEPDVHNLEDTEDAMKSFMKNIESWSEFSLIEECMA
jgi:hypothetical protein